VRSISAGACRVEILASRAATFSVNSALAASTLASAAAVISVILASLEAAIASSFFDDFVRHD
jgi:hypothetical protein